ncbi:MAG: choice-of-anchor Q domain-containing protein [Actinomycetota bacterium]
MTRTGAALALAGAFLIVPSPSAPAATTLTVNTLEDELNTDGDCSLREAITAANTNAAVDACGAGSGADTIDLPTGIYGLAIAGTGEDASATGDLDITEDLTITGDGAATTVIDANDLDRVVHVSGGVVAISDVTITDGTLGAGDNGGGIINTATLHLNRVVVTGNTADDVGGVSNYIGGTMTVVDSTISDNISNSDAGGFYNTGSLTISGSTISGNTVVGGAKRGGGFYNDGPLTITNSTISGNSAAGGGIGGGIHVGSGSIALLNTTITGNTASLGSGIDGSVTSVQNTIVASNAGSASCAFVIGSGFNLDSDSSCFSGPTAVHADPLLGALAFNGGQTHTHALSTGSPAIDAGTNAGCPGTDQRGIPRPQGPLCDLGSFEVAPPLTVNTLEDELNTDGDCSLREAVQAANTDSPVDACGSGDGADTITLAGGTYQLSIAGSDEDGNQTGDLDITSDLTITGANSVVNAGAIGDRGFDVYPGIVAMSDLKVQNGSVTVEPNDGGNIRNFGTLALTGVTVEDGTATGAGGGIYNGPGAVLTLSNTSFTAGPTGNAASSGGALFNDGTATVAGSSIANATATCCGGGIQNNGSLTITSSSVTGNEGGTNGGGILNGGGATMTIDDTDVTNNTASDHPGVANDGTLTITNGSLIAGNQAYGGGCGGGLWNTGELDVADTVIDSNTHECGAGFYNVGQATVSDSTISNNTAVGGPGGIGNDGDMTVTNATISGNSAPDVGGVRNNGTMSIVGGTVIGNSATFNGGGLSNHGTLSVDGTTIVENSSGSGGGGINDENRATITNALIEDNVAATADCCGGGGLNVGGSAVTTVDGVTFSGNASGQEAGAIFVFGQLTLTDSTVTGNTAVNNAGGIHVDSGAKLVMIGGAVTSNSAPFGGGISSEGPCIPCGQPAPGVTTLDGVTISNNTGEQGGGISAFSATVLNVSNSTISGNDATLGSGGGILSGDSTLFVNSSTVSGNTAADGGGGIETGGTATISDSTFDGNAAAEGGGLRNFGTATIDRSTFSDNTANGGGGIENAGTLTITNNTISGNSATGDGGGIITEDTGTTVVRSSTISGNSAPTAAGIKNNDPGGLTRIKNTIIANSIGSDCQSGTITSAGWNLIESPAGDCSIVGDPSGNIIGLDPMLGSLADNGGPTFTHLPQPGSPVFDAGSPDCPPPDVDQRGVGRPIGGACEIGSVEEAGAPAAVADLSVVKTDSADPVDVGQTFTYTVTVSNAGPQVASNVTLTDVLPAEVSFVSFAGRPAPPCTQNAGTVSCTWASLGVGSSVMVKIKVTAVSAGSASNTATADADQSDPDGASDTETTTINGSPPGSTHTLTVTRTGTGQVKSSPAGINCGSDCLEVYSDGTTVTLTAKTRAGTTFAGWDGDCASAGTSPTCVLVMDSDKAVTATFT